MEWILWAACAALLIAVLVLAVRVYLLRRSAWEIAAGLAERISTDTNTLIGISSRDRAMRALAESVNTELRALRRERRRLQQGDRELREAVTNISHDLRTPLTAICGYLELLGREEKSAAAARYLGQIENRTAALTRLTEELFRYSLVLADEAVELQPVVLNRVLEESLLAQYGAFQARGLAPAVQMPQAPVTRRLDPAALSRIYDNILSNALKYAEGDLAVTLLPDGTAAFSNTARGLTQTEVGRLFDRFYTVETGRSATGLGLSIARLLTERMGGTIGAAYSGEKLTVRVCFPETPET
ncbi:sensor histidine kinase [Hominenteromicrobium sp.]